MNKILTLLLLSLGLISTASASIPMPVQSFAALPQQTRETKFQEIQEAFEQRAVLFLKGRHFEPWKANKSREDLLKEFDQLNEWRYHSWYVDPSATTLIARADFMIAQDLLENDKYRFPQTIAFDYNKTDASYNSSTIVLNGLKFLAMESPTSKTYQSFLRLLINHQVTQLVRLGSPLDKVTEKSYPYWEGKLKLVPKSKSQTLTIPQQNNTNPYLLEYFALETWPENKGVNPKELLNLIMNVRKYYDASNGLLACHCAGGTGRTGTFLSGFLLLTEIDKQIAGGTNKNALNISIERIVMQLSLQRPYMVVMPEQYITLYKLVDLYVQSLK